MSQVHWSSESLRNRWLAAWHQTQGARPFRTQFSFCSYCSSAYFSGWWFLRWDWGLLVLPPFALTLFLHKWQMTICWLLGFPSSEEVTFPSSTSTGSVAAGSDITLITSRIAALVAKAARVSKFKCQSKYVANWTTFTPPSALDPGDTENLFSHANELLNCPLDLLTPAIELLACEIWTITGYCTDITQYIPLICTV